VAQSNSGSRDQGNLHGRDCDGVQEQTAAEEQNRGQEEVGVGRREASLQLLDPAALQI